MPSFFSPNFPNKICNHRITVKTEKQNEFQDNITDKIKRLILIEALLTITKLGYNLNGPKLAN